MSAPKVFVSYSRKDHDITQRLVADLNKAGAEVWVDVDGIQSGNFMQAIDQALTKCDWMVLVLSPSALESNYVSQETYTALHRVQQGYMKAVVPVLVAQCTPGSIPPQWDVLQRYDATQDYDSALDRVLKALGLAPLPPVQPTIASTVPPVEPTHTQLNELQFQQHVEFRRQEEAAQLQIPPIPPDRFPQRLADLGFTAHNDKGVEYILPPLCPVPEGPFLMGSDPKRDERALNDEKSQYTIALPAYAIARFPVTVAEYACFVRTGQQEPEDWPTQLGKLDHPVRNLSRFDTVDTVAYAAWLSERTGERWRLPTEAEWEKAARGTDGRIYPWGDTFAATRCNTSESDIRTTTSVGSYPNGASPYGAEDMAGNVFEWTSSLYKRYPYKEADGRENQNSHDIRVMRGGSWSTGAGYARAAFRGHWLPASFDFSTVGFRLVRAAPNA